MNPISTQCFCVLLLAVVVFVNGYVDVYSVLPDSKKHNVNLTMPIGQGVPYAVHVNTRTGAIYIAELSFDRMPWGTKFPAVSEKIRKQCS